MLYLNRKTEYALLAIEHMAHKEDQNGQVTSTREVSEAYHLPYPLLAKVLQKLANKGLIKSVHGTKGGYILTKRPLDITVAAIVEIFDRRMALTECFREEKITCPQWECCHIKDPLYELNLKIQHLLAHTTLADLVNKKSDHHKDRPLYPLQETPKAEKELSV